MKTELSQVELVERTALGTVLAQHLRRRIVTGTVLPGHHLVETAISAEFNVSRGPVRDALKVLESEGLVESARQGVRVVGLNDEDITELYSLRGQIETLALRLCIERNTAADWDEFERPLEAMSRAAERGDAGAFAAADLDFHTLIYRLSRHRRLLGTWLMQCEPTFQVLLEVTTRQDRDLRPVAGAHDAIIRFGRSGDTSGAETELQSHLDGSSDRLRTAHRRILEAVRNPA
jgi:GntR family transcriptional regulator of gluconate operon